jgi:alkylhydroperoxidase family enzyme
MTRADRRAFFDRLIADVCGAPAHLSPAQRQAAAEGAELSGAAIQALAVRIREAPHLVTDAEVEAARAEGLDDDQLYELTVATALGESRRRLDAVARALREGKK